MEEIISHIDNHQEKEKNESPKRSFVFWFVLGFSLLGIDQLVKFLVFRYTGIFPETIVILYKNFDFAFSLKLPLVIIYLVYVIALLALIWFIKKRFRFLNRTEQVGAVLVMSGGLANFFERIVLGYVRDFLSLPGGGIINLADVYIVLGLVMLLFGHRASRNTKTYDPKNSDGDSNRS